MLPSPPWVIEHPEARRKGLRVAGGWGMHRPAAGVMKDESVPGHYCLLCPGLRPGFFREVGWGGGGHSHFGDLGAGSRSDHPVLSLPLVGEMQPNLASPGCRSALGFGTC